MRPIVGGSRRRGATLSGGGGGVTPDWEVLRDFNSGTIGTSAQGQPDGFDLGATQTLYTTEQVYSGAQAVKSTIQPGQTGTFQFGGYINTFPSNVAVGDSIWLQWYVYVPTGFTIGTSGGDLKFMRFQTLSAAGINQGYVDTYIRRDGFTASTYRLINEMDQASGAPWTPAGPATTITRDTWLRINKHVVFGTSSQDSGGIGRVRMWENGVLLADKTDRRTMVDADSYCDKFLAFTYWNGENAPQTQSLYIDHIRLAKNGIPSWALDLQGVS